MPPTPPCARRPSVWPDQVRLGDVLARLGPERFGVLMRHGGHEAAEGLARRVTQAVAAPLVLHSGDEVGVGISVGMAAYSDATESCANCRPKRPPRWVKPGARNARRWQMFAVTHRAHRRVRPCRHRRAPHQGVPSSCCFSTRV